MGTLVILRHAKAANPPGVADMDRPLTVRGRVDAAAAGAWLAQRGYAPDLVLCSPSRRTQETWREIVRALPGEPEVRLAAEIYDAATTGLEELVTSVDDAVGCVLVIGHNPGLSDFSAQLDPAGADPEGLRTAGIAVHSVPGSWAECGPDTAPIIDSHTARDGIQPA